MKLILPFVHEILGFCECVHVGVRLFFCATKWTNVEMSAIQKCCKEKSGRRRRCHHRRCRAEERRETVSETERERESGKGVAMRSE